MRRATAVLCVSATLIATSLIGVEGASAATGPSVTKISSASGPLAPRTVILSGRHLNKVHRVRFGSARATGLHHYGTTKLTIATPRARRTSTVAVQIRSARRWRTVAHYTFVAAPTVARLSRASVPVTGQTSLTLSGRDLGYVTRAAIGSTTVHITKRSATALTLVAPAELAGRYAVSVSSIGGTNNAARLSYVLPAAADSASYTKSVTTASATDVLWVSGGPNGADPASDASWTVAVGPGAVIPAVGQSFLLAPGGTVFPSGLAGTASSIAAQSDGSTRITVAPAPLDQSLSAATVRYSDGPSATGRHADADTSAEVSYPDLEPQEFACTTGGGEIADMTGSIGLRYEDIHRVFSFSTGLHPSLNAYVTGTVVSYGKVTVDAKSVTCSLKPSWVNANRKVLPLGDGATLSFGPAAEIKISAAGTVSIEHRTQFMYGLSKSGSSPVQYYRMARQQGVTASTSVALSVEVSLGVSVQFGLLDRVGIEVKPELFAEGSATLDAHGVCVDLSLGVKVSIGAFLDFWVKRWEYSPLTFRISFTAFERCVPAASAAAPSSSPQITSDVLLDAQVGTPYSTQLKTADNRAGAWTVISGTVPPGLRVSNQGIVSGTPTSAGIGSDQFTVRFVDSAGRADDADILLEVDPNSGLGGGDIQATLTWNSAADLDLHGVEPDGVEIYYDNPGPTDSDGELDHDANAGCATVDPAPAENIHWPSSEADSGEYDFAVVTYSDCEVDDLSWHLVVRVRGVVVIDQTGSGDSDWYSLQYSSATGAARVTRHAVRVQSPRAPARGGSK